MDPLEEEGLPAEGSSTSQHPQFLQNASAFPVASGAVPPAEAGQFPSTYFRFMRPQVLGWVSVAWPLPVNTLPIHQALKGQQGSTW
jgi:hypothetical protein